MQHWKRAIVVGASSGMGKAVAEALLARGVATALVARRREPLEAIAKAAGQTPAFVYTHDVRDYASTEALLQQITKDLGGLDLIVYASGVLLRVEPNEFDFAKDREMVEVNLLGGMSWLNEASKRFSQTQSGTIIGISSVAGERGRRGLPGYGASKAGMTTYLEALRNRLASCGVKVVTILPGYVDTEMTRGRPGLFWLISSSRAAELILRAGERGRSTVYVSGRWRYLVGILKLIPSVIFKHIPV